MIISNYYLILNSFTAVLEVPTGVEGEADLGQGTGGGLLLYILLLNQYTIVN